MRIAGAGCCLMDLIYAGVDFSSAAFAALRSRADGDGGLAPGRLVFSEDAERFSGRPFALALATVADGAPAAENVGGPSVVALIHAAQMLEGRGAAVSYYGAAGDDELGRSLRAMLARTCLDSSRLESRRGRTPSTYVLSDPRWDGGRGERCFVNDLGAALAYGPEDLPDDFFEADIVALGGTALVPALHEGLPAILARARASGALTVVNTVFDFRAERADPLGPWPLGGAGAGREAYRGADLVVMDQDEALRLSGERGLEAALRFFESSGAGAFAISRGGDEVVAWSGGGRFEARGRFELPVSARAARERGAAARGDTTGCGDNFAGGIIAALAEQMMTAPSQPLDLAAAISWGIAAGAFTLGLLGGTYYESGPGEKRALVASYRDDWLAQVGRAPAVDAGR
jgi:sugar/nucleoside kinase (ribokinase family)